MSPIFSNGLTKKSGRQPFIKFSGFVGDTKADIMTVLREFDEGILRGEEGRKDFNPPYLPLGGQGTLKL